MAPKSKFIPLLLILWISLENIESQVSPADSERFRDQFRFLKMLGLNLAGRSSNSPRNLRIYRNLNKLQPSMDEMPFPCSLENGRSSEPPKSVHKLKPGDIDVIGAIGDSLTAGNGGAATNIFQVFTENRGISWSIGGQGTWREYLTLPNMLKEYNPKLFGYSLADSFTFHKESQFNVAEAGAMSRDTPYMAKMLVKRISSDPRVNFAKHWKLITMMIGPNDFCLDICYKDKPEDILEQHREHLHAVLRTLKQMPRTLVQIVLSPNVALLTKFLNRPLSCRLTHLMECPCFFGAMHSHKRAHYEEVIRQWQKIDKEVADLPEYADTEDFGVVVQTFPEKLVFPLSDDGKSTDFTLLSADCFHFSQKGYSRATNALWNNMFEPVGNKSMTWKKQFEHFNCPTLNNPYICTNKNCGRQGYDEKENETDT
ncbi:phospholipase B1, membrane-associated-like [Ctenocephalides felis]|uniref:phospholipase B1, membrane-associated-like n=1 Tax=Ctenocephalides felis TaxID=7515 RepID=UPI000E6E530F|nr:phospholipase B1, membrane-associated-like [Ctenocephalides felis]